MQDLERIEKIFRLLGSTHDGEIINAVNSIRKILLAQDKNFSDLANHLFSARNASTPSADFSDSFYQAYRQQQNHNVKSIQEYLRMCKFLINMPAVMTTWESTFIADIYEKLLNDSPRLTGKQKEWLHKIYKRYTAPESKEAP